MKHWDEALKRAFDVLRADVGDVEPGYDMKRAVNWLAEFVIEKQEQATLHVELSDPVATARQLTVVQARCTELLEEVRSLRRGDPAESLMALFERIGKRARALRICNHPYEMRTKFPDGREWCKNCGALAVVDRVDEHGTWIEWQRPETLR
jgi:hypothetical protein